MKKIAIAVLVLLAMSLAGYAGQTATVIKVKVQTANVRAEADTAGAVIKQIKLGTLLESRAKVGDWYEVAITTDTGGQVVGFISATVVDVVSGGQIQAPVREEAPVRQPARNVPREEPPVAESGNAPSTGGFKVLAVLGAANMSFTDTSGSNIGQYQKARTGFGGGIGFELGSSIGFEIDFLYLQKGVHFAGSEQGVTFDSTMKIDEVSVPVLLKFHVLNKAGSPDIYLLGGGEIAYVMSAKVDYTASGQGVPSQSGSRDVKDNVSQIDYGAVFGGGVALPLGGIKLFIEGRYHLGFANMEKSNTGTSVPSDAAPKTNLLAIAGGFKF